MENNHVNDLLGDFRGGEELASNFRVSLLSLGVGASSSSLEQEFSIQPPASGGSESEREGYWAMGEFRHHPQLNPSQSSEEEATDMAEESDMNREELKAHLEANEERVRRMTEGVSQKLDKHLEVIKESNERFKAEVREDMAVIKESNKWTYRISVATLTVLIIVVSLIGILLR